MPKRCNDYLDDFEELNLETVIPEGEVLTDIRGKQWKLGKTIGIGGFGEIYLASDNLTSDIKTDTPFVAKIERHTNGPLFVEINCYLRLGKTTIVEKWKKDNRLYHLGIPNYIASGSHIFDDEKYRFIILPKYEKDLDRLLHSKQRFNLKTVLSISIQIMDILEYIHSRGYVHSDIKASNIMLGKLNVNINTHTQRNCKPYQLRQMLRKPIKKPKTRNLRPITNVNYLEDSFVEDIQEIFDEDYETKKHVQEVSAIDKVYLIDYGLASKYLTSNGEHKKFGRDERKAHAGTVLFCSRDAHKGMPSRRSDLESLAYNIIYWLTGSLPWVDDIEEPVVVERKKTRCFQQIPSFLGYCFSGDDPSFLCDFFKYLNKLQFHEKPDYDYCRTLFKTAITDFGYKNNLNLDLDNLEGWGNKQKKFQKQSGRENKNAKIPRISLNCSILRPPLQSNNIVFKRPKLRKKSNNKINELSMMNWSKILVDNPEVLIKQANKRHSEQNDPEGGNGLTLSELNSMNPTYAMIEVFNKSFGKYDFAKHRGDNVYPNIQGYTPAMMNVYIKMKQRQEEEKQKAVNERVKSGRPTTRSYSLRRNKESDRRSTRVTKSQSYVEKKFTPVKKATKRSLRLKG